MKKISLIIAFMFLSMHTLVAQDQLEPNGSRDEIKVNVFNLIAFTYLDGSYERLIDEESSFGVGVLVGLGDEYDIFDVRRNFSITPYYRRYFSKGYAKGFFVEGFGMLHSSRTENFIRFDEETFQDIVDEATYTDFALGVSIGGKFVSKKGFVAEVYGGIGRNFFNAENTIDIVARGGISLGFRF